jgi:hypothetical protein
VIIILAPRRRSLRSLRNIVNNHQSKRYNLQRVGYGYTAQAWNYTHSRESLATALRIIMPDIDMERKTGYFYLMQKP